MKKFIILFLLAVTPAFGAQAPTFTVTTATVCSTTGASILAANKYRRYLEIINRSSVTIYLKVDAVHASTEGIALVAGASWSPAIAPGNAIWCVAASGTTNALAIISGG